MHLTVHAAKNKWQYYAIALQDQDMQYVELLPVCQVTLHVTRVLHCSAFIVKYL